LLTAALGECQTSYPQPVEDDLIKIWFRFVPREGWPSLDTEGL
jgi:hypothetical protein